MEKNQEIIMIETKEEKKGEESTVVRLSKVYQFEGETISEVDMSGLESITAKDMVKANKALNASGNVSVLPETNLEYCLIIAASATGRPVEFFLGLMPVDALKVKNRVTSFFFKEE